MDRNLTRFPLRVDFGGLPGDLSGLGGEGAARTPVPFLRPQRTIRGCHSLFPRTAVRMIEVKLDEGDKLDWALKTFKKKVMKSGLLKELRKRRHYTKPSEAKAIKSAAARRRGKTKKPRPAA